MSKRILYRYIIPALMIAGIVAVALNLTKKTHLRGELIHAVKHGSFSDIELAIKHGADINMRMEAGQTPLHSVAYKGDPNRIKFMLDMGADLGAGDFKGGTPLHWAALNGKIKNVKALIRLGADINATDNKGQTPLHWTVSALKINIPTKLANINVLLANGANPFATDVTNRTALDYARLKHFAKLVSILELYTNTY